MSGSGADRLSSWPDAGLSVSVFSSSSSSGTRGFPPRLASTTVLLAVGASMIRNSLAVKSLGKIFHRKGMRAVMITGKPRGLSQSGNIMDVERKWQVA